MTRHAPGDLQPLRLHQTSNDNRNVDPHGLLSAVLHDSATPAPVHSAHDCLLSWLLELPADLDPAIAAQQLLAERPAHLASARACQVAELLAETAHHPRVTGRSGRVRRRAARP